ncbi:MAG: Resolvase, terminal domain, partial [Chthonomonadales bacterium]|nr:Resolvase, terminal domain [Chthonomonadales bacterium]
MNQVLTIQEIIQRAKSLQPIDAVGAHSINPSLCATQTFTSVKIDGEVIPLFHTEGRVGAGYVRVSTDAQRSRLGDSAFSEEDQITRIVNHFIHERQPFRLFSDCGISGQVPTDDPQLIEEMLAEKAIRYREIFEAVFFDPSRIHRFTALQRQSMRAYLENHLAEIAMGNPCEELNLLSEQPIDYRGRLRKTISYRPGLTLLMRDLPHIHTLVVTDLSRLSRNHFLFGRLSKALLTNNVRTVGLMLSLSFMNSRDIGDKIQAQILPLLAEHQLREILLNTMRGILMMLESGKAHGKLPSWLIRTEEGSPVFKPGAKEAMERMVELFLTNDENDEARGFKRLERALTEEGYKPTTGYATWNWDSIRQMLANPALVGMQHVFGLDFPVFPRLISDEKFQQIHERLEERKQHQHIFAKRGRTSADAVDG